MDSQKKGGNLPQLKAASCQEEASFCIKMVKDLQKLSRALGRDEVAKSIGSLVKLAETHGCAATQKNVA